MDFSNGFLLFLIVLSAIQFGEASFGQPDKLCPNLVDHPCRCLMKRKSAYITCSNHNESIVLDSIKKLSTSRFDSIDLDSDEIENFPSGLFEKFALIRLALFTPKLTAIHADVLGEKSESSLLDLLIVSSKLSKIPKGVLKSTKKLRRFGLRSISLEHLEEDIFNGMESSQTLRYVSFNGDKISSVEKGAFKSLTNLEQLKLKENELQSLSVESFGDSIAKFKEIQLDHNKFTSLPSDLIEKLPKFSKISMEHNSLTKISKADLETVVKRKVYIGAYNNQLICNCDFEVLAKHNEMHEFFFNGFCYGSSEEFLVNRYINSLVTEDFAKCHV